MTQRPRGLARWPVGNGQSRARRRKHRVACAAVATVLAETLLISATVAASSASASSVGVNPANYSAGSSAFRIGSTPWPGTVSYNPYNPDFVQFGNVALFGLAAFFDHNRPGSNPYYPELAQSWTLGPHSVTFNLQPNATWQDGTPFTSKDVITSLLVTGGEFNPVWADITSVTAPNLHTVVVNLQPWAVEQNVLLKLFQFYVVPNSQYGSLVPSGLEQDLLTYWKIYDTLNPTNTTLTNATNSPAGKAIDSVSTNIAKYNPPTLVGDGAYKLVSANVSGTLYEKWTGFWDAKAINAPFIEIYPMSVSTQFGSLETGRIEFQQDAQFTDPQVDQLDSSQYGRYIFIPSAVQQESLVLHLADYPLGILQVRQALEDAIDRTKLTELDMGGTLIQDPPTPAPDGINDFLADDYLTKAQIASLNPYSYNLAKAASLLESVGFKKKGGTWYTPKGNPWDLTISEQSSSAQFDTDGIVIADELKAFGINASSVLVDAGSYNDQQSAGNYAISEWYMDWQIGPPMADFAATFGEYPGVTPAWNYPVSYNGKTPYSGQVAIGFNPVSNVPGLGTVNISQVLNAEINEAPPSTWSKYTWDWARWFNQDLPFLPLYDNAFHEAYSMSRYTNFPPGSAKWLWTNLSDVSQPVVWMQNGYLTMK
jgi:peptide/nickel transport system substrate-binding protein